MTNVILDELFAVLEEISTAVRDLDARLGKAYDAFLIRLANRLYSFGYRVQGKEYEPYDPYNGDEDMTAKGLKQWNQ